MQPDTLKLILETLQAKTYQSVDLIDKVDSFYNNAWGKLILFGSILFGLVGFIVPLFIQFYQKRILKVSETELKNKLKSEITTELLGSIKDEFDKNEKQIKMLIASANSKIFFSQAKYSLEKGKFTGALGELVTASYFSMECDDYKTLQSILDYVSNNCLSSLSLEEIDDLKTANICDLNTFLSDLTKKDDRAMFQTIIGDLKVKITKLPKKIKDKPDEKSKRIEN
jgi:hypothetical protein